MAETTVTTNSERDKLRQRVKLLNLENVFLRHEVTFFQLLAAERKLKAKRLGLRAHFYEGLYKRELHRQEQARAAAQATAEGNAAEQAGGAA